MFDLETPIDDAPTLDDAAGESADESPRSKDATEPASPVFAADPGAARDTLQLYLSWIRDIPLLDREQAGALSAEIDACEARFREALYAVPGAALGVLERWEDRRTHGRTTAMLAHGYRGDVKRDWAGHIDRHLGALSEAVERMRGPRGALRPDAAERRELADHLRRAEILLEELFEVHDELVAARADYEASRRRRHTTELGLGRAAVRASLDEATRAREERDAVRRRFATHNLRLVVNVAKRFRGLGLSYMDLIQEGNKGLMRAVEKFDHTRGFTFSTYAVWWIDQAIIRGIQNHSRTVRVPSHVHQEQRRLRQLEETLRRTLERDPTEQEIAEESGLDLDEVERIQTSHTPIQSLDEPVGDRGKNTVSDTLVAPDGPEPCADEDQRRIHDVLTRGIRGLDERERTIVQWRYGLDGSAPQTLRAIGKRLGISRERVRQIEVKALGKLRGRDEVSALAAHVDAPLAAA